MAHRNYRRPVIDLWWIPEAIYSSRRFIAKVRSVVDIVAPKLGCEGISSAEEDQLAERRYIFFVRTRTLLGANAP